MADRSLPHGDAERFSVELEAASLRVLRREYQALNAGLFSGRLRSATLGLAGSTHALGRWVRETRRIELARTLLTEHPWGVVVEVLKHEMAHQYVDEVLGQRDETPHGTSFRQVCSERGIDARSAGLPTSQPDEREQALLQRVTRLLALAQSANEHEARAAMAAAQRLMLKHNLAELQQPTSAGYGFAHLGTPSGRIHEGRHMLALILSEHFFVDVLWVPVWRPLEGKRGSVLEVCGTPANLQIAGYVHDFLLHTAERLWADHKRAKSIRSNRDRLAFQAGVMSGFREKLRSEQQVQHQAGLVWLGDARLRKYMRARHPHVRSVRRGSSSHTAAHHHGRAVGARIVLHKGVTRGPSGERRLLPRGW